MKRKMTSLVLIIALASPISFGSRYLVDSNFFHSLNAAQFQNISYKDALDALSVDFSFRYQKKYVVSAKGGTIRIPRDLCSELSEANIIRPLYKETYCNVYVQDMSDIRGWGIPKIYNGVYTNAKTIKTFLDNSSEWEQVSFDEATQLAGSYPLIGQIAIAGAPDHVFLVDYYSDGVLYGSEAGSLCRTDFDVSYYVNKYKNTRFYVNRNKHI